MPCGCNSCAPPQVPPACWFLAHDRKAPCGCGGKDCEKYQKLMAKLILCGFDPFSQEDCMFLRYTVVNEAGNGDKTVAGFAKWKSGHNSKWRYMN